MKHCITLRSLGALWLGSSGYLTLSEAGFVSCCSFLQPRSLSLSMYPLCSVTSTWLVRYIVALATGRNSQPSETKSSVCNEKTCLQGDIYSVAGELIIV